MKAVCSFELMVNYLPVNVAQHLRGPETGIHATEHRLFSIL